MKTYLSSATDAFFALFCHCHYSHFEITLQSHLVFCDEKIKSVNSANKIYEHLEQKVDKCYSNDS